MRIGGIQKVSLIDYPGQISAVVFTQGCNFRCPYCHNPELVNPDLYGDIQEEAGILSFLDLRRGKLDAVTLTGGEPTLQEDLPDFIRKIREMDYLVKLDTNGAFPEVLKTLIDQGELAYVAMDIKAPLNRYKAVTRAAVDPAKIRESVDILMASGIDYEFRTTAVPSLITKKDLVAIAREIGSARRYIVQRFNSSKTLDGAMAGQKTFSREEMGKIKEELENYLPHVMIRG
jgi:pyruvate formate lyase activating enzyme